MKPYASIILPTFDRHETLPIALQSGLEQTVEDIELILALDGATSEVREIAYDLEKADSRIVLLDLPKSPFRCGQTREYAIEKASSDRIFVLQDDDLWFPFQIETMGPALDMNDLVSSTTLVANCSQQLLAWPTIYGEAIFRNSCLMHKLKFTYEAHYAFRKSSYYKYGVGWGTQTAKIGHIRHLLDTFCAVPYIRCESIHFPTGLSLNSPPRSRLSQFERAKELCVWKDKVLNDGHHSLYGQSSFVWHFYQISKALELKHFESLNVLLEAFGYESDYFIERTQCIPKQYAELELCWNFFRGERGDPRDLMPIVCSLVDSVEGHEPDIAQVGDLLIGMFPPEYAIEFLKEEISSESRDRCRAILLALQAYLCLRNECFEDGLDCIQLAINDCVDLAPYFCLLEGHLFRASSRPAAARKSYIQAHDYLPNWSAPLEELNAL